MKTSKYMRRDSVSISSLQEKMNISMKKFYRFYPMLITLMILIIKGSAGAYFSGDWRGVYDESSQLGISVNNHLVKATSILRDQEAIPEGFAEAEWGKIRASIERDQYRIHKDSRTGVYLAPNRAHDFDATFTQEGFDVRPRKEGKVWNCGLRLSRYGYGLDLYSVPETDEIITKGNRIEYHRGDMVEWYINDHRGLEQGFTLKSRPSFPTASGFLELHLQITGNLIPEIKKDGKGIVWKDVNGNEILNYNGLYAYDATGRDLPAQMKVSNSMESSFTLELLVDVQGAVYPVTVDPTIEEVKKLVASDVGAYNLFGHSVSVCSDTVVIGAGGESSGGSSTGAAYVFQRNQGGSNNWGQVQKLVASDAEASDVFGISISISGDTVVVGAFLEDSGGNNAGAAYIFQRNQGGTNNWGQVKKLVASDAEEYVEFGYSVSISGDTVVVGAYAEDSGGADAGAAYVFQRNQGGTNNWGQVKKLVASDAEERDEFGYSISISGDTVVIGARGEESGGWASGAAYVFQRNQGGTNNWGQAKKLVASDAEAGDQFGCSVSISSDIVVVGAYWEDSGGDEAGAAYVFQRNQGGSNNWGQVKKLIALDTEAGDEFGISVSISGDTVVVGADGEDSGGADAGATYVFQHHQGGYNNWGQVQTIVASDAEAGDRFGNAVSINDDTIVVGAYWEDSGGTNAGTAYVFEWTKGYVATSGIDTGDCSDPLSPCRTIAYARQQVPVGIINVAWGKYAENLYISSATTGLKIIGGWDQSFSIQSEDPRFTIIDGGNMDSVIKLNAQQSIGHIELTLTGLTLTGGNNTPGGGITITNEELGEVYLSLHKCAIKGNEGGGIAVSSSRGTTWINLDSCVVMDNTTGGYGGGLDAYTPAGNLKIDIENTIIANNHASHKGGGIRVFTLAPQATLSLRSSTISGNSGSDSGGVYLYAYGGGNLQADILNSILWGNRTRDLDLIIQNMGTMSVGAMYSDIGVITDVFGQYSDQGNNISEDPLFQNPAGGDYHLKEESPAVDNALCGLLLIVPPPNYFMCLRMSPLLDFEGDSRPSGCLTGCDMGADEFKPRSFPWILFYPAIIGVGR